MSGGDGITIETLNETSREEIVEVFADAFATHPLMPPDPTGRLPRRIVQTLLSAFASAPDARVFGIRQQGRVLSAAFVFDADYEPRRLALIWLLLRMLQLLGWRLCRTFAQIMNSKPKDAGRQLELMILGTRPECQGQGMGRALVRYVLDFARGQGYQSVALEVAKETPAFHLYVQEGFESWKELELPQMPLCLLIHRLCAE